ncbi:ribbon-helix-helix protein, CopG family [Polynucleobacter sp. Latsch14-2]|jgi:Arc/MetJ-type ribon-helix-helix transcriptional regulator|uniref:ribbon-helix-helix protein, CopG family n=1 Tax=Polynucleobacter sp. Latsch14-2 TaxID=2576920 RepID=UPI001C0CCF3B|nr:ribbon-helix-helix protein, CopG family [Polynucleobacter sp. Latsch14-2]
MERTNIHLPKPFKAALLKISESQDVSVAELIRRAIAEFLDKEQQSLKKSARLKKIKEIE